MDGSYWLGRSRTSLANAASARCAAARLVHFDLAGRYSVKAAALSRAPQTPSDADEALRYAQLETGARWLASRATQSDERCRHLGAANRYAALRIVSLDDRPR